jgi:hypothetical protein
MLFRHRKSKFVQTALAFGTKGNEIGTGYSTTDSGVALVQNQAVSKFCTKADGSLVWLQPRTNIHARSEDMTGWARKPGLTVVADQTISPRGDLTADKIVETSDTSVHQMDISAIGVADHNPYCYSIYVKVGAGRQWIQITKAGGSVARAWFDIVNGVAGSVVSCTSSIQSVGNGWFRCSMLLPAGEANGGGSVFVSIGSITGNGDTAAFTGDPANYFYAWGAQFEAQQPANGLPMPTPYIPTTSSGGATVNPVAVEPAGIMVESQSTNLLTGSNRFDLWTASSTTVTRNVATAPDGTMTATQLTFAGTSNYVLGPAVAVTDQSSFTGSIWLRAVSGTQSSVRFHLRSNNGNNIVTNVTPTLTTTWQRFQLSGAPGSANLNCSLLLESTSGAQNVLVWGSQIENGPSATSYIPTPDAINLALGKTLAAVNTVVTASPAAAGAFRITDNATSGPHYAYLAGVTGAAGTYTYSFKAKLGSITYLSVGNSTGDSYAVFNLGLNWAQTIYQHNATVTAFQALNGWVYCTMTFTALANDSITFILNPTGADSNAPSYVGTGQYLDVWNIQCEVGSTASPYIGSQTSQRAADSIGWPAAPLTNVSGSISVTITPSWTGTPANPGFNWVTASQASFVYSNGGDWAVGSYDGNYVAASGNWTQGVAKTYKLNWDAATRTMTNITDNVSSSTAFGWKNSFTTIGPGIMNCNTSSGAIGAAWISLVVIKAK